MIAPGGLRLIDEDDVVAPPPPTAPTVFVRTISAPAGAPWDQARAAALEARIGAPLPLADVVWRLRRLDTWRVGRPATYAACYVRARDVGDHFKTTVVIDGRSVTVSFVSAAYQARKARSVGLRAAAAIAACLLIGGAGVSALAMRAKSEARLSQIEQLAAVRLNEARTGHRLADQAHLLTATGLRHARLEDVLSDIEWISDAKTPGAHIDAFHWDHGYIGLEVRGDVPPIGRTDRSLTRSSKPIETGLWLWGVSQSAPAPTNPGPSAQTLKPDPRFRRF